VSTHLHRLVETDLSILAMGGVWSIRACFKEAPGGPRRLCSPESSMGDSLERVDPCCRAGKRAP
jgi:hypothetical protein